MTARQVAKHLDGSLGTLLVTGMVGFLAAVLGFCRVVGGMPIPAMPRFTEGNGWVVLVLGTCSFFLGIGANAFSLYQSRFARDYRSWFGLELPVTHWQRVIQQPAVNHVLKLRAIEYDVACREKAHFTAMLDGKVKMVASALVVQEHLTTLSKHEAKIRDLQDRFWKAHNLAGRAGLKAFPSFRDYLNLERADY